MSPAKGRLRMVDVMWLRQCVDATSPRESPRGYGHILFEVHECCHGDDHDSRIFPTH